MTWPKDLPPGWAWKTMGDVADVVGGGTPRTGDSANYEGGSIPWITPADLSGYTRKCIGSGARFITEKGLKESSARTMPAGTVLFTSRAPIGYVAIAANPVCTNQGFKSFVLREGVSSDYVYWWLKGNKQNAESLASGTTFLELSGAKAKQIPIPVAPPEQQKRIVAEIEKQFSRLDEAVANLKRVKANVKRYRAGVLQAGICGKLNSARHSQSSSTTGLPGGWHWATIGELASRQPRSIQSGPFGSNLKHSEFGKIGRLVIGIDNVQDGRFSMGAGHRISEEKFRELEKYAARPGDVLVTVMATIGRTCIVPDEIEPAIITKHVYRITPNREAVLAKYLYLALRGGEAVRTQLLGAARGQTRPGLNGSILRRIRVPVPPLDEQADIVEAVERRLSMAEESETQVEASLRRAERLRQAILRRAFYGELVSGDADDEPAGVLLDLSKTG